MADSIEEKSFSTIILDKLKGLVDECERFSNDRYETLLNECSLLRSENEALKRKLGQPECDPKENASPVADAQNEKIMVKSAAEAEAEQSVLAEEALDEDATFAPWDDLMQDAVAGKVALQEEYWLRTAARPNHDQAFMETGSTFHHDEDSMVPAPCCMVNPAHHLKLAWDILGIPILGWDLITIPMQVFDIGDTPIMVAMSWVTLVYWTIDIPFTFLTGYYDDEGCLVMNRRLIAKAYIRGFFPLDFVIVAADWTGIFIGALGDGAPGFLSNVGVLRMLRISRIIRLMRLRKLKAKIQTLEDNIDSEWWLVCLTLLQKILFIMALNHYIGCIFYWMGKMRIQGYETWLTHHPYPQFGPKSITLETAPWGYKYITSVHWAITQFTPGSMHIQAQNIPERIFSIFCLLFGLVVFSSFIASVTQARMQLNKMMSKFERDLWLLRKYCRQNKVSHELTIRMKRYVDMVVVPKFHKMSVADVVLLPQLSTHLREELHTELASQNLHLHPFFQELIRNKAVMTKVCTTAVTNLEFARGDVVFNAGQLGNHMYVVTDGVLEYIPHSKHYEIQSCKVGSFICEAVLWTQWTQQGQLQASVECSCMTMHSERFRKVLSGNALVMAFARRYAFAFLEGMNKDLKEKGMPCDLQQNITFSVDVKVLKKTAQHSPEASAPVQRSADDNLVAQGGPPTTSDRRLQNVDPASPAADGLAQGSLEI
jgi:hypothetical protein